MADNTTPQYARQDGNAAASSFWSVLAFTNPFSSDSIWWGSNDPKSSATADHTILETGRNAFFQLPVLGQVWDQYSERQKQSIASNVGIGPNFPSASDVAAINEVRKQQGKTPIMNADEIKQSVLNDLSATDLGGGEDDGSGGGSSLLWIVIAGIVLGLVVYAFAGKGR